MARYTDEEIQRARQMREELNAVGERWSADARRRDARRGTGSLRIGRERITFEVRGVDVRDGRFSLGVEHDSGWLIEGTLKGDPSVNSFQLVTQLPNSGQYTFLDDERCFNFAENTAIEVSRRGDRLELGYTGRAFVTRPGSANPEAVETVECEFRADCGSDLTGD